MSINPTLPRTRSISTATYAIGGLIVALAIIALGNIDVPAGQNGGTGPGISTAVLCAVVTLGLFIGLLPRVARPARVAVVLGVLAVLSIAVFWSGLTPVLAAAAAAALARSTAPGRAAQVWTLLAGVATLVALGVTIAGSSVF